jgi:signal transduction histidine kinase
MLRQNFRARLIIGAALWISVGLCASGLVVYEILRGVVVSQFEHDLTDHAAELATLLDVEPGSRPLLRHPLSDARFQPPRSGLYWQVQLENDATLRSPSLEDALFLPVGAEDTIDQSSKVDGPTGPMRLIRRILHPSRFARPIEIRMGADERLIDEEMSRVQLPLVFSLATLALGLIGAAYAQVAFGLQPLTHIRREIGAIRCGKSKQLSTDLPREVLPLVFELNGMIAANLNMVERARTLAGNFAHALKTPLAILAGEARTLEHQDRSETARVLLEQCSRITLLIDYQTARARASALTNAGAISRPAEITRQIIDAHRRLYSGDQKSFEFEAASDVAVACDPHDLTEMIGNIIDNAAKWAKGRIVVTMNDFANCVELIVEDDGPGIPAERRTSVFGVGVRLDETMPGTGLGLAIARDLATLYGAQIRIECSRFSGAAVHLVLNKPTSVD